MGLQVFIAGRMSLDEIHEGQRVVGVGDGSGIIAQRQPANAPMVILQKLAVGFLALLLTEHHGAAGFAGHACLLLQIGQVSRLPMRPGAVGLGGGLDLENPQIDAHLDDLPTRRVPAPSVPAPCRACIPILPGQSRCLDSLRSPSPAGPNNLVFFILACRTVGSQWMPLGGAGKSPKILPCPHPFLEVVGLRKSFGTHSCPERTNTKRRARGNVRPSWPQRSRQNHLFVHRLRTY